MKAVRDFDVKNKRVLVRCDFNVSFDQNGNIADDFRIRQTLVTIQYLIKKQAKIILLSHLGKPTPNCLRQFGVGPWPIPGSCKEFSLRPAARRLEELLKKPIQFLDDCLGKNVRETIEKLQTGQVVLLENLRFYKEEEENNPDFARELAKLADLYINDAFSACHRQHSSVATLPKLLPSGAGLLLESEIKNLSRIIQTPKRPLVGIIGGAKIAFKIELIEKLLAWSDHLLLGGKIANTLLAGKEMSVALDPDVEEARARIEKLDLTNPKLHLPVDGIITLTTLIQDYLRVGSLGAVKSGEAVFDIGPETLALFSGIIQKAKTVFWSGPLGYIEDKRFAKGSLAIAKTIIKSKAFSVVGGGETDAFLSKCGLREKFSYISTGGGAMLEFLSGKSLPGIEAIK